MYSILISKVQNKPSSNFYFENVFDDNDINWAKIYLLPCLVAYNTYMRYFQYKLLNRVLFLNKKLHTFGTKSSSLLEQSHTHYVPSAIYATKQLYKYFMNVIILNEYGQI